MTAVVGILNKRGVAIAADSAVTRTCKDEQKVTKNGNKMVRVSNAVPIGVMITSAGDFLNNPWDIVIRCYRRERGNIAHPTVEACLNDLFEYISSNEQLWGAKTTSQSIWNALDTVFNAIKDMLAADVTLRTNSKAHAYSKAYCRKFIQVLKKQCKAELAKGMCPPFEEYTIEDFRLVYKPVFDEWVTEICKPSKRKGKISCPKEFMNEIAEELEQTIFAKLTTRAEMVGCIKRVRRSVLVFTGYGVEQEYPSLVAVTVGGGFENRVNYHYSKKDIVCINDETPVAICPFAQTDIAIAITGGLHRTHRKNITTLIKNSLYYQDSVLFGDEEKFDVEFSAMLAEIKIDDLLANLDKELLRQQEKNKRVWERNLKDYDLNAMAALAESMIDLTGVHRILTFSQEGVGGPVDVAVITKNDGFSWLNRKSWYHHKDVNGQYGKLGI